MTNGELHDILDDENKKISLKEFRDVIYKVINSCASELGKEKNIMARQFYNGEINALYIALDLSEHIEESENNE